MSDLAKLEYHDGRVIITRCFSEDFNAELKETLPKDERGFDWDAKYWWALDQHGDAVRELMKRYFGAVQVFGHPVHGDFIDERGAGIALQNSLFE